MSASDKPDLARGWRRAEKLLDEEGDRIAAMSDEEFEREMSALPDPAHVPTADKLRARGAERARRRRAIEEPGRATVRSLPSRTRWVTWLVAAAHGVLVVLGVMNRRDVIAWFTRDSIVPDVSRDKELVRQERVKALRREGFEACAESMWTQCEGKLDEAKRLDPAGEVDPRVKAARQAVDDARRPVRERPTTPDSKK